MTDRDVIQLFEQNKPKTIEDIQALGLSPRFLDKGISRRCYQLTQTLVVKVPDTSSAWDRKQSENEIACLENLYTDGLLAPEIREQLEPHLMPLFYGDKEAGIVVTRYYAAECSPIIQPEEKKRLVDLLARIGIHDMHYNNFRVTESGKLVAIDLGYSR